jgi:hypothetical protein
MDSFEASRIKVIIVEFGVAFWGATFLFPTVINTMAGVHPNGFWEMFGPYWFGSLVIVFVFLWCLRKWFMPGQWIGRDLKGSDWRRVCAIFSGFFLMYWSLWFFT